MRKAKYDLDEAQTKPYFELNNVLQNGVFYAAHMLYGLTFKERHDIPVYNPDVRVFEVFDADGKPLALWYCDYFKRDNKNGGAWMSHFVDQSKLLGTLAGHLQRGQFHQARARRARALSFDDVTTMFHEFGHALHGMFADTEYPSLSGTDVPRDFVEFPSQFNEHWASYPAVFDHYARNYKTGAPMPAELAAKMQKAKTFNQGYMLYRDCSPPPSSTCSGTLCARRARSRIPTTLKPQALKKTHLDLSYVPPRYRSSYFLHIWGNGYAAGYYAYLWSEMLDDDAFQWFQDHGGLTRANGDRFRQHGALARQHRRPAKMYEAWLGAEPNIGPMLKDRGLEPAQPSK